MFLVSAENGAGVNKKTNIRYGQVGVCVFTGETVQDSFAFKGAEK